MACLSYVMQGLFMVASYSFMTVSVQCAASSLISLLENCLLSKYDSYSLLGHRKSRWPSQ